MSKPVSGSRATVVALIAVTLALCCFVAGATASGARVSTPSQDAKFEMGTFYIDLLVKTPKLATEQPAEVQKIRQAHLKHLETLAANGKLVVAGPFVDTGRLAGLAVVTASSAEEAKSFEEADPLVKAGLMSVEVLKWWAAKGIMKPPQGPINPSEMTTYYFGLISRGPNWTAERTPEVEKLQADHMANINRLAKEGKLVIAGPFENAGNYAGVFVFKAASLEEAKALAQTDPAVKAERLVVDVHPWMVSRGSLP
ncbi:MAG TPA: YciI family protein [Blastocatellia bacterium]|nr:YciI family protein [Blastocatellia bacterium]